MPNKVLEEMDRIMASPSGYIPTPDQAERLKEAARKITATAKALSDLARKKTVRGLQKSEV
jgi:predicted transcriptional regulator